MEGLLFNTAQDLNMYFLDTLPPLTLLLFLVKQPFNKLERVPVKRSPYIFFLLSLFPEIFSLLSIASLLLNSSGKKLIPPSLPL